ncbi:hypothetical protein QT381_06520 [Galbitalea sp. SE-J8]|uniref:hypothetical protein n=1 Tax=Galbitalea sp. SE-J8 TaxID=3054952 RepID=UPI00259CAC79|nr:hypothetical protein [Galbitalea sp. SE-J8]MDM4762657.1 hypothetical protein [Galbitalea sp. SE-J8]
MSDISGASDATSKRVEENADVFTDPATPNQTVTNDAVAGEPVIPTGHYAGPERSEPLEATPVYDENDLADEAIDLGEQP